MVGLYIGSPVGCSSSVYGRNQSDELRRLGPVHEWRDQAVVRYLSQRLSHACLGVNNSMKLQMAHLISYQIRDVRLLHGWPL
jgi:hypothetical protein